MKIRLRSSIALKMGLLILGGTSLVLAVVLGYSYSYSRKIILADAEKNAKNLTLSVARRIEQEFRAVKKVPLNLAYFLQVHPCRRKEDLLQLIQRLVAENKEIYGSTVAFEPHAFDEHLRSYSPYFYKSNEGLKFEQLADESYDYFQKDWYRIPKLLGIPVWAEPYFDEGGGNIVMTTYSTPLFTLDEHGKPSKLQAVIGVDMSLEGLTKLVDSVQVGRSGYCFIVSDTGTFVTHPRPDFIMRQSMFSLAEEYGKPSLRKIGRAMIRERSGWLDMGKDLTREEAYVAFARIPSPGWSLAAVFPKAELFEEVVSLHQITVVLAAVGLSALVLVGFLVSGSMALPLRRMAAAASRVAKGDLDLEVSDVRSTDEIGRLAEAFNRMTEGLKERDRIRDTFGRYVTREVVKRLLESKDGLRLGGESREISLIMSDLRGFTALTSHMSAAQVITFLNRYLGSMVEILIDHRGIIDEIIGDGILAFFGAPEPLEDHPGLAVSCALKMQLAMDEINALNEADGLPHLEMGVAVNTGEVVVGNIGSEKRAKYGAVGSQVNFTGRLESYTVGGQVLISQSTYERLVDILDIKEVLRVEMKGIPGTVLLYDVRGIKGQYNLSLPDRDEHPVPIAEPLAIQVFRLDQKAVGQNAEQAWITDLSMKSALISFSSEIGQWENVKMLLPDEQSQPTAGEMYAKVVAVTGSGDTYRATVRFTSVSPEAYAVFRSAVGPDRITPRSGG
jgi:class 3 adenylate cyclase